MVGSPRHGWQKPEKSAHRTLQFDTLPCALIDAVANLRRRLAKAVLLLGKQGFLQANIAIGCMLAAEAIQETAVVHSIAPAMARLLC